MKIGLVWLVIGYGGDWVGVCGCDVGVWNVVGCCGTLWNVVERFGMLWNVVGQGLVLLDWG